MTSLCCTLLQVLRLFHFLVKFGYYGSEDIKALLRPLIAVLDSKHDKPFPHDSDKGRFTSRSLSLQYKSRPSLATLRVTVNVL